MPLQVALSPKDLMVLRDRARHDRRTIEDQAAVFILQALYPSSTFNEITIHSLAGDTVWVGDPTSTRGHGSDLGENDPVPDHSQATDPDSTHPLDMQHRSV